MPKICIRSGMFFATMKMLCRKSTFNLARFVRTKWTTKKTTANFMPRLSHDAVDTARRIAKGVTRRVIKTRGRCMTQRKDSFWHGTGRHRPVAKIHTKAASVSMRDIAAQHPGSVYASLVGRRIGWANCAYRAEPNGCRVCKGRPCCARSTVKLSDCGERDGMDKDRPYQARCA